MKVFLNNGSGTISSTAIFSITSNVIKDCKISTGDFNKDGWNDIVMGGRDTIRVFENIKGNNLFSTSTIVNYIYYEPTIALPKKIMVADLTNEGGLSVLFSGHTQTFYESDPQWLYENILRMNPSVQNTNPAPPYLFESYVSAGSSIFHPKLKLFNRGDRDFQKYRIYKKNWVTYHYYLFDSTTSNEYIDTTEDLLHIETEPIDPPPDNLFYYAVAVDNSYKESITSDTISYIAYVCPTCFGEIGPDNFASHENHQLPKEYSLSNYPNLFNPSTKIFYTVPKEGGVKITVYNSIGQKVNELLNEFKNSGAYVVEFDGSNVSSGIYYYVLESNGFVLTKKMLLLK